MTADDARAVMRLNVYTRTKLESLIRFEASMGHENLLISRRLLEDNIELDLIVDGFDVKPSLDPEYLSIEWRK